MKKENNVTVINDITEEKILAFMKSNPDDVDYDSFKAKLEQVKLGMQYVRDREMMKRISQGQTIRVFNLVSGDKDQLKEYIQISMPEVIPKLEKK